MPPGEASYRRLLRRSNKRKRRGGLPSLKCPSLAAPIRRRSQAADHGHDPGAREIDVDDLFDDIAIQDLINSSALSMAAVIPWISRVQLALRSDARLATVSVQACLDHCPRNRFGDSFSLWVHGGSYQYPLHPRNCPYGPLRKTRIPNLQLGQALGEPEQR